MRDDGRDDMIPMPTASGDKRESSGNPPIGRYPCLASIRGRAGLAATLGGFSFLPQNRSSRVAPAERGSVGDISMSSGERPTVRDMTGHRENAPSKARRELVDGQAWQETPPAVGRPGFGLRTQGTGPLNSLSLPVYLQCPAQTRPRGAWPRDPASTHGYQRHPEMGTGWRFPNLGALWGRRPTLGRLRRLPSVAHTSHGVKVNSGVSTEVSMLNEHPRSGTPL